MYSICTEVGDDFVANPEGGERANGEVCKDVASPFERASLFDVVVM